MSSLFSIGVLFHAAKKHSDQDAARATTSSGMKSWAKDCQHMRWTSLSSAPSTATAGARSTFEFNDPARRSTQRLLGQPPASSTSCTPAAAEKRAEDLPKSRVSDSYVVEIPGVPEFHNVLKAAIPEARSAHSVDGVIQLLGTPDKCRILPSHILPPFSIDDQITFDVPFYVTNSQLLDLLERQDVINNQLPLVIPLDVAMLKAAAGQSAGQKIKDILTHTGGEQVLVSDHDNLIRGIQGFYVHEIQLGVRVTTYRGYDIPGTALLATTCTPSLVYAFDPPTRAQFLHLVNSLESNPSQNLERLSALAIRYLSEHDFAPAIAQVFEALPPGVKRTASTCSQSTEAGAGSKARELRALFNQLADTIDRGSRVLHDRQNEKLQGIVDSKRMPWPTRMHADQLKSFLQRSTRQVLFVPGTETGVVGDDTRDMLLQLFENAKHDPAAAKLGVRAFTNAEPFVEKVDHSAYDPVSGKTVCYRRLFKSNHLKGILQRATLCQAFTDVLGHVNMSVAICQLVLLEHIRRLYTMTLDDHDNAMDPDLLCFRLPNNECQPHDAMHNVLLHLCMQLLEEEVFTSPKLTPRYVFGPALPEQFRDLEKKMDVSFSKIIEARREELKQLLAELPVTKDGRAHAKQIKIDHTNAMRDWIKHVVECLRRKRTGKEAIYVRLASMLRTMLSLLDQQLRDELCISLSEYPDTPTYRNEHIVPKGRLFAEQNKLWQAVNAAENGHDIVPYRVPEHTHLELRLPESGAVRVDSPMAVLFIPDEAISKDMLLAQGDGDLRSLHVRGRIQFVGILTGTHMRLTDPSQAPVSEQADEVNDPDETETEEFPDENDEQKETQNTRQPSTAQETA